MDENRRNRYISSSEQEGAHPSPDNFYMMNGSDVSNRGKVPRNYKRSDALIREIVCDVLCDNPELHASNIDVEVKDSEVILSGEVTEKYAKRLAEDLAESVTGVTNIQNRIRVSGVDRKHG